MNKNIASNIHNLLKDYHQTNGDNVNEGNAVELGVKLAKEIAKLPASEHILAWNIIGDSFASKTENELKDGSTVTKRTATKIADGALSVLTSDKDRENFIKGYTRYDIDKEFVSASKKKAPPPKKLPLHGIDIESYNIKIDKEVDVTLRNVLKDYHKYYSTDYNEETLQELGYNAANEIAKLPANEHQFGWNIVGDSLKSEAKIAQMESRKVAIALWEGAKLVLGTEEDRQDFINGYTFCNLLLPNVAGRKS